MTAATITTADVLKFQNDMVRTGNYEPLGRMQKIAIGPNALWNPAVKAAHDPILQKFGRFIELRNAPLPIGQTRDRSQLLICAPFPTDGNGVVLPDLPDPEWVAPAPTKEEIEGVEVEKEIKDASGKVVGTRKVREFPKESPRHNVKMLKQSLFDRADSYIDGTNFLVFSPVLKVTFQPELNKRMVGDAWVITAMNPDGSLKINPYDNSHLSLIVDRKTGEAHFYGGLFEILGNSQ